MKIVIFANAFHTNTISGGDRIFAEYAKRWIGVGENVLVITNEEGEAFCLTSGISKDHIVAWPMSKSDRFGVYPSIIYKSAVAIFKSVVSPIRGADVVFAASYFWPDLLPAIIAKIFNPRAKQVTACYFFTRAPLGEGYSGGRIKGFFYSLAEMFSFHLISLFGDAVFTASPLDRGRFISMRRFSPARVIAIRGGVDVEFYQSVQAKSYAYDGVFVGRLHPQKCIDELIDIWKIVISKMPGKKLAIIGSGPQESELRRKVLSEKMDPYVTFLGLLDGIKKIHVLKASRLFVSASRFDTGNMALDEGLACGVPGIVYNLARLHYTEGVTKVTTGDKITFADAVVSYLSDKEKLARQKKAALRFAKTLDWGIRAQTVLTFLKRLIA